MTITKAVLLGMAAVALLVLPRRSSHEAGQSKNSHHAKDTSKKTNHNTTQDSAPPSSTP